MLANDLPEADEFDESRDESTEVLRQSGKRGGMRDGGAKRPETSDAGMRRPPALLAVALQYGLEVAQLVQDPAEVVRTESGGYLQERKTNSGGTAKTMREVICRPTCKIEPQMLT